MNAPVNSKSLFSFVCEQMAKLDRKESTVEEAKAQANLAKQANNVMKYELDRANTEIKLAQHNKENTIQIELRQIEVKGFSDTTKE